MLKELPTTLLILGWCFALSLVWSWICFSYISSRLANGESKRIAVTTQSLIPSLVWGPLCLIVFYRLFGTSLIFPLSLDNSPGEILSYCLPPAIVLLLASGAFGFLGKTVFQEYQFWRQKPFARVTEALGKPLAPSLRKLVLIKSLSESWLQCLPWLFGELFVVEAVFNAPGLAFNAWQNAKERNLFAVLSTLSSLLVIYAVCSFFAWSINRWVGRKLESYA